MRRLAATLDQSQSQPVPVNAIPPVNTNLPVNAIPPEWNEYLSWLSFAVPGMLDRCNVDAISFALEHLPNDAPMWKLVRFVASPLASSLIFASSTRSPTVSLRVTDGLSKGKISKHILGIPDSSPTNNSGHSFETHICATPICFANLISRTRLRRTLTLFSSNGAQQKAR
jgi:hypothetical protein